MESMDPDAVAASKRDIDKTEPDLTMSANDEREEPEGRIDECKVNSPNTESEFQGDNVNKRQDEDEGNSLSNDMNEVTANIVENEDILTVKESEKAQSIDRVTNDKDTNTQPLSTDTNNITTDLVNCDIVSSNAEIKSDNPEVIEDNKDTELEYFSDQSESGDEYESAEEGEESHTDSANLKEQEEKLTDEEKQERQDSAKEFKDEGNQLFRDGSYKSAIRMYSRGLRICPLKYEKDRSVLYANRAACKVKLEEFDDAIRDCSKALDLNGDYMKVLVRRAELYEQTEKLDEALADYQKILELDPSQHKARAACMKLPEMIKERNEKLKDEMMGKLKELGNMVLRPFGLSTNNFKMNQDPNSGGYSVNFVQSPDNGS